MSDWSDWSEDETDRITQCTVERKADVTDKSNTLEGDQNENESNEVPIIEHKTDLTDTSNDVVNDGAENKNESKQVPIVEQNTDMTDKSNDADNESAGNKNESNDVPIVEQNTDMTNKSKDEHKESANNRNESNEVPIVEQNTDLIDKSNDVGNESADNKNESNEVPIVEQNTDLTDKNKHEENESAKNSVPAYDQNLDVESNEAENTSDKYENPSKEEHVLDNSNDCANIIEDKVHSQTNEQVEGVTPNTYNTYNTDLLSPSFRVYRKRCENKNESDNDLDGFETDSLLSTSSVESIQCDMMKRTSKKKKGRKRARKTRQKLKYIYSTDDDIPLSFFAKRTFLHSDSDNSYDPANEDGINSTDSEYGDLISKKTHRKRKKELQQLEKQVNTIRRRHKRNKETSSPRKTKKQKVNEVIVPKQNKSATDIDNNEIPKDVAEESAHVATLHHNLIEKETEKVDKLLREDNLIRDKIKPFGNCFFEASAGQINMDPAVLRQELCKTLEENMEDYIQFLLNHHHPNDEETFVEDYLTEVAKLKEDGYWTNSVADLLPLVLANYSKRIVVLYTNKDDQNIIIIIPTVNTKTSSTTDNSSIKLVYTSIPNVYEHYDACHSDTHSKTFTAHPVNINVQQKNRTPVKNRSPRKKQYV